MPTRQRTHHEDRNKHVPGHLMERSGLIVSFVFLCGLAAFVIARATPQDRTFVVTGHPGEAPVVEISGRSYVEIEALTHLMKGSLSFAGNQIVLTLPSRESSTQLGSASDQSATELSKDFLKAALEEMSVIREWRSALLNASRQIYPVTEQWVASLATSTESDRNALQLLTNEFNNMKKLSDRFVEATRSRTYIALGELDKDPLDQKILNCAHSLAAMASNKQFTDDGACH